jgi:hypothetical protein
MAAATTFIFDASPLIASCQFAVGKRSVADIALSGATVQIPPAVYEEVIMRGELNAADAQQIVQAVTPRYPVGFVPHSLAMLRRLNP